MCTIDKEIIRIYQENSEFSEKDYKALWRAVLLQALTDAKNMSKDPQEVKAKREAISWIFDDNQDFNEVCMNAEINPGLVRSAAEKMLEGYKKNKKFLFRMRKLTNI